MTSPFGYDYYLSLATLRDADNDTLVDAYLAGMAPVAGMLSETLRNLTELNETLKASRETHLHARRALAHARGARRVATEESPPPRVTRCALAAPRVTALAAAELAEQVRLGVERQLRDE